MRIHGALRAAGLLTLVGALSVHADRSIAGEDGPSVDSAPAAASAPVQADGAAPSPTVMPAVPAAMGSLQVNVGFPEDLADFGKTVIVPTVYVKLLIEGKAFAAKQGSALLSLGGRNTNSVKASAKYKVQGIDKAFAQALAQKAHDDFVAQLRAAGYTVLTYKDIAERDYIKSAAREQPDSTWGLPLDKPINGNETYLVASPSDEQMFKYSGLGWGPFAEFVSMGKPRITDATIVIPQYTIVAPQVWAETGSSYSSISAEIKSAPGMNLQHASVTWMGKPKVRMGGGPAAGVVTKAALINVTDNAGALVKAADTTPTAANAISKGLSLLTGFGGINSSSAEYSFTVDPAAYVTGATKGISAFNAEVVKAAASAAK